MNPSKTNASRPGAFRSIVAALATALTAATSAQTVPAIGNDPEATIVLPQFNVSAEKDTGYIASDTMSAGRLSTNMLKTPADVSTLTRDFLDDIAVNNLTEAAVWLTNATVVVPNERDFGTNITFRGLPTGGFTRDYFAYPITVEEYIVDRVEGSRGPNSIIYGDGNSGGQVNTLTKRASFRNFAKLGLRMDSEGTRRVTLDANRKLNDKLALRVNALWMDRRTYADGFFDKRKAVDATVTYRPWKGADFRAEGEIGTALTETTSFTAGFLDGSSLWDGKSVANSAAGWPSTSSLTGTGLTRYSTDTLVASPDFGPDGIVNLKNFVRTSGTFLRTRLGSTTLTDADGTLTLPNLTPLPSRSFFVRSPDWALRNHFSTVSGFYNQSFDSGLTFEFAALGAYSNQKGNRIDLSTNYIDVNTVLPTGATNPNFGKVYSERNYDGTNGDNPQYSTSYRAGAAYPWITSWFKQTFSAVATNRITLFEPTAYRYARLSGPTMTKTDIRDSSNLVTFREYWDQPHRVIPEPTTDSAGNTYGWVLSRDAHTETKLRTVQLNTVGDYFHDTLKVIAGWRFDRWAYETRNIATFDARGYPLTNSYFTKATNISTHSIGGTYFPIKSVGLFANYSQAFAPNSAANPDINGNYTVPAAFSTSKTVGLRFNALKGRLVGSVGYYRSTEKNRSLTVSASEINAIWRDLGKPEKQVAGGAVSQYIDTFDYDAHGYEADVTANLTQALRIKANVAFPWTWQANSFARSKEYLAANLGEWQAYIAAHPGAAEAIDAQNKLGVYQNTVFLNAQDNKVLDGTYAWRGNVYATYEFQRGALKGWRLGGGANVYGRHQLGTTGTVGSYRYYYDRPYYLASATVGYRTKVAGVQADFQVNVTNLFDYDRPIFQAIGKYQNAVFRNSYLWAEPRKATLSATFSF